MDALRICPHHKGLGCWVQARAEAFVDGLKVLWLPWKSHSGPTGRGAWRDVAMNLPGSWQWRRGSNKVLERVRHRLVVVAHRVIGVCGINRRHLV